MIEIDFGHSGCILIHCTENLQCALLDFQYWQWISKRNHS